MVCHAQTIRSLSCILLLTSSFVSSQRSFHASLEKMQACPADHSLIPLRASHLLLLLLPNHIIDTSVVQFEHFAPWWPPPPTSSLGTCTYDLKPTTCECVVSINEHRNCNRHLLEQQHQSAHENALCAREGLNHLPTLSLFSQR